MQSQVRSNRVLEKVPEKVGEALVQSQVKFNRVPEQVLEKVPGGLVQSQVKFNRVPKKVPEKVRSRQVQLGAEPGQVAEKVPEKVLEKVGEQSQVRFNRSPEKFREKVGESLCRARSSSTGFGAEPGQVQQGSGEGSGEGVGSFGVARSGSTGFRRRFQRLASQHASKKIVKIGRCGCWDSTEDYFKYSSSFESIILYCVGQFKIENIVFRAGGT